MNYDVAACSDIGIKKQTNQDALSARIFSVNEKKGVFAVLCDGMGGLSCGEIASATLVEAFMKWLAKSLESSELADINIEKLVRHWNGVISEENRKIISFSKEKNIAMGSTAVVFLMIGETYYVMNVGDSRAYMISSATKQITHDHTFIAAEIQAGRMTAEEAEKDPRRNVLLQCIGMNNDVKPEYYYGKITKDTCFLLCSDGFVHKISESEMYDLLAPQNLEDKTQMQSNLVNIIECVKSRKETDNISAVLIRAANT